MRRRHRHNVRESEFSGATPGIFSTASSSTQPLITPSSFSPLRDVLKTKPVVIPTEKIPDSYERDVKMYQPVASHKSKIDIIYSSADDKYNPKFRKPQPEDSDVVKKVSESIESSMKSTPITFPEVLQKSPIKPQLPLFVPLSSPTITTTSTLDNEVASFSRKHLLPHPPQPVSSTLCPISIPSLLNVNPTLQTCDVTNNLANPNITAPINIVVDQSKGGRQTSICPPTPSPYANVLLPIPTNFQNDKYALNQPINTQWPRFLSNRHHPYHQGRPRYCYPQNVQPIFFTPLPPNHNQYNQMQPRYPPPQNGQPRFYVPLPPNHNQYNQMPPGYPPPQIGQPRFYIPLPPNHNQYNQMPPRYPPPQIGQPSFFIPLPPNHNQYNQMQPIDYYPMDFAANHNFKHLLSAQYDNNYEARPSIENVQFNKNYRGDWRRSHLTTNQRLLPMSNQRPPSQARDPRFHKDSRFCNDLRNGASTPRIDSRAHKLDDRNKLRDPRLKRFRHERERKNPIERESTSCEPTRPPKIKKLEEKKAMGVEKKKEKVEEKVTMVVAAKDEKLAVEEKAQEEKAETKVVIAGTSAEVTTKTDENVASTSVSSSTECESKNSIENQPEVCKESAEIGKILSAKDMAETQPRDEPKPLDDAGKRDLLHNFFKKLLENERTKAAKATKLVAKRMMKTQLTAKLQKRSKRLVKVITKECDDEEPVEEEEKKEEVVVSVVKECDDEEPVEEEEKKVEVVVSVAKECDDEEPVEEEERKEEVNKEEVVVSVGEKIQSQKNLHEDIQGGVLTSTGKRICRVLKTDNEAPVVREPRNSWERFDSKTKALNIHLSATDDEALRKEAEKLKGMEEAEEPKPRKEKPHDVLEYSQLHFGCTLCVEKFPSPFSLKLHMRSKHNVINTIRTPLVPNKVNVGRDEFILSPVPTSRDGDGGKEGAPKIFPNCGQKRIYGPDEISQLPRCYIFNVDVRCALCSYFTKVRMNLVRHLKQHSSGTSVPDRAPVNLGNLDKNEKTFDKMTNLAISSFSGSRDSRTSGAKRETKVTKEETLFEETNSLPSKMRKLPRSMSVTESGRGSEALKSHEEKCPEVAPRASRNKVDVFSCTYCHERGNEEFVKNHHKENHSGFELDMYQYICLECSGTFSNLKEVLSHFPDAHAGNRLSYSCIENKPGGSKDYLCTKCPFRSGVLRAMRCHLKKHVKPVDCLTCGATFVTPNEARAHHNKKHWHINQERVERNNVKTKEYKDLVAKVATAWKVKPRDNASQPSVSASASRPMLARKSTGAPFVREKKGRYGPK